MRSYVALLVGSLFVAARAATPPGPLKARAGGFADPPSNERTRFRYWLPDGGVDPEVVKADVKSMGSVGCGGLEFLGFFEYGGHVGSMPAGADWVRDNFGSPSFQRVFKAALESHAENGLWMDFPVGPNQGQGVPADVDDDGLQWDLVPYTAAVQASGVYDDVIPGWGDGELVALTSALVVSEDFKSFEERDKFDMINVTYNQYWLKHESLADHTGFVSEKDGHVTLQFPQAANGSHYRVFSFFQKKTLNKNLEFDLTEEMAADTSIFRNGSYAVDHFSARGAETVAAFWEKHILTNGVRELLIKAGNYAWEDSVEVVANISWSRSMPDRWTDNFGTSINPYLPLFAFRHNNLVLQPAHPGKYEIFLDGDDILLQQYQNNFHHILAEGYAEYVEAMGRWAHDLGKELSIQPAYNLPLDMAGIIPLVDAPECESFGFNDSMETYRRFVGPAQLGGRRVISNELGALPNMVFQYTIPRMLFSINRGLATGVNQYVLHGGQYTGNYHGTTWPGHVGFAYLFSEPFSEKQPMWHHGFEDAMDYTARVGHVIRTGTPKVDLVRYSKHSITRIEDVPELTDLLRNGWTYTVLSADNFGDERAHVADGILSPEGPAWKSILIERGENLTVAALGTLNEWARAGLPVFLSGGDPGYLPLNNDTSEDFERELSKLVGSENVYQTDPGNLAEQLTAIGLSPRVSASTNGTFYTSWYDAGDISYAVIYSDSVISAGQVTVATSSVPYFFNPWTGERTPVLVYSEEQGKLTIPLTLAANQLVIIGFSDALSGEVPTPSRHVVSSPPIVLGVEVNKSRDLAVLVKHSNCKQRLAVSDGTEVDVHGLAVAPAFHLSNWTLVAERWEAPANMSDASIIADKRNTTHQLTELVSWDKIPALSKAAGVGYYTTTFNWSPAGGEGGAMLHLGRITHSARVLVNGQRLSPLDIFKPEVNMAPYLRAGENTVDIVVPTTMWNYLRGMLSQLKTAGSSPLASPNPPMEVGLVGPVTVTPFGYIYV